MKFTEKTLILLQKSFTTKCATVKNFQRRVNLRLEIILFYLKIFIKKVTQMSSVYIYQEILVGRFKTQSLQDKVSTVLKFTRYILISHVHHLGYLQSMPHNKKINYR